MYINQYWVETYGEGEPVVFLHGFTGSGQTWHAFRDLFSNCRMMMIDLPGHGKTKAQVTSMEACCQDVKQLLTELNIETCHLIGYSLGGRTALTFATMFPAVVRSLILESASPGIKEADQRLERKQQDDKLASFIREHPLEAFVDKWEQLPLFASQKKLPVATQAAIRAERLSHTNEGLAHSLEVMGTGVMTPCWDKLQMLAMPVLLLAGKWDSKFIQINQQMVHQLKHGDFMVAKRAGHAIHVEQSEFFGTMVKEFIAV